MMVEVDEQKVEDEKMMKKKTHIDHEGHNNAVKTLNLTTFAHLFVFIFRKKLYTKKK